MLKGKLKCGWCDESMWKRESNGGERGRGKYEYYMCSMNNRKKYGRRYESKFVKDIDDCVSSDYGNNNVGKDVIEKIVWDYLFIVLKNSEVVKESYKKNYGRSVGERNDLKGKLGYYEKELKGLDKKRLNFIDLFVKGDISKEDYDLYMNNEIKEKKLFFEDKISGIRSELSKVEVVDNIDGLVNYIKEELKKDWKKERFEDRKRVVDKWIEMVRVKRYEDKSIEVFLSFRVDVDDLFDGSDEIICLGGDDKLNVMLLKS